MRIHCGANAGKRLNERLIGCTRLEAGERALKRGFDLERCRALLAAVDLGGALRCFGFLK